MKNTTYLIFVTAIVACCGVCSTQQLLGQDLSVRSTTGRASNSVAPASTSIDAPPPPPAVTLPAISPPAPQIDAMWGYRTPATYVILPRPSSHHHKDQPHAYRAPDNPIVSKPVEPYAYGWFGTKYSPQWQRQFGFQKAYTQWTLK